MRRFVIVGLAVWLLGAHPLFCNDIVTQGESHSIKQFLEQGGHLRLALAQTILQTQKDLEILNRRSAFWVSHIYFLYQNKPYWQDRQVSRIDYCLLKITFQRTLCLLLADIKNLEADIMQKKRLYNRLTRELNIARASLE